MTARKPKRHPWMRHCRRCGRLFERYADATVYPLMLCIDCAHRKDRTQKEKTE